MTASTSMKSNVENLHDSTRPPENGLSEVDALLDEIENQELASDKTSAQNQTQDVLKPFDGKKVSKTNSKVLLIITAIILSIVCLGAYLYISATPKVEKAESLSVAAEQTVPTPVNNSISTSTVASTTETPILENPNDIAIDATLSDAPIDNSQNWEKLLENADQNSAVQPVEPASQVPIESNAISNSQGQEVNDEIKQIKSTAETAITAAESVANRMSKVENQQAAFGEKIESTQRAITQVANLMVRVQSEQKVISNELVSVRSQLYKNESSIKEIEAKAIQLQDAINSGSGSGVAIRKAQTEIVSNVNQARPGVAVANVSTSLNSKPATDVVETSGAVITLNGGAKETIQPQKEVTLKTFTLLAIVKDKAIIKDASGKLYPIELGAKYKSLGSVTRLDKDKMEAIGMFDTGIYWIIKASQQ